MAMFGDEDGDVGPFVMAEGGEEWFPFSLDNLEMDRACSSPQEDSTSMDQEVCVCVFFIWLVGVFVWVSVFRVSLSLFCVFLFFCTRWGKPRTPRVCSPPPRGGYSGHQRHLRGVG